MPSQLLLIVDDPDLNATYGGGQWTIHSMDQWYGGTIIWPQFADSATSGSNLAGSLALSFEGTAIAFSGNTPKVFGDSQILTVSIDGAPSYNTSYDDPTPQSYLQWYQSPTLLEGTHNITLTHMYGTALDYAVITAGQNTPLSGKKIVVDNEDASIRFTGAWKRNTDRLYGYPFHNSTHQSATPGDSFAFRFSGESLYIYGNLDLANLGTFSATYTLDNATTSQNYSVTTIDLSSSQRNFLLFSYPTLAVGDHTLVVSVANCVNQTYIFDYLTYQPSFSTLATMPNLTLPASLGSINARLSATTAPTPVRHIIGGVLGGLALLFLLIGGFLWFRKKKSQDNQGEGNRITAFPIPSSGPEILGPQRAVHKSPRNFGAREMTPTSTTVAHTNSTEGGPITTETEEGPLRAMHKSPRSVGARQAAPTSITVIHTNLIEGGDITTEPREAVPSIAPPAYADLTFAP